MIYLRGRLCQDFLIDKIDLITFWVANLSDFSDFSIGMTIHSYDHTKYQ